MVVAVDNLEYMKLLRLRVAAVAERVNMRQLPEYAPIKAGGHESGDFIFVRTGS